MAESCCISMYGFNLVDTGVGWWIPDRRRILDLRADEGLVAAFISFWQAEILLEEGDCLVGPLGPHINVAVYKVKG